MNRKPIFDRVRALLGRGLAQSEVSDLDAAIEASLKPTPPTAPEQSFTPDGIGPDGIALIKAFEGCRLTAYRCPAGVWTIGYGSTAGVKPGDRITQQQADDLLAKELVRYSNDVVAALGSALARTSQQQFDALVSFHYNTGAIRSATLTARHRAGDFNGAAAQFLRWNKAGGRVLAGLTRRREAERALYLRGSR